VAGRATHIPAALNLDNSRGPYLVPMNAKVGLKTVTLFLLEIRTMASYARGRGGSRTHAGRFGFGSWGPTVGGQRKSSGRKTVQGPTGSTSPKYRMVSDCFANKISSYKTLYNQTRGPARFPRPTPQILNTFSNLIDKGAIVQTCSTSQLSKWARMKQINFNSRNASTTACKNVLNKKFGKTTIKAVARTKSGAFMVATSPTWKGKIFSFPK